MMNEVQAQELAGEAWAAGCKLAGELLRAERERDDMRDDLLSLVKQIDMIHASAEYQCIKAARALLGGSLPEGMTCGDCVDFTKCRDQGICSAQQDETRCDWIPSRFVQRGCGERCLWHDGDCREQRVTQCVGKDE